MRSFNKFWLGLGLFVCVLGFQAHAFTINLISNTDAKTLHDAFNGEHNLQDAKGLILGFNNPNASALARAIAQMAKSCQIEKSESPSGGTFKIGGFNCPISYAGSTSYQNEFDRVAKMSVVSSQLKSKLTVRSAAIFERTVETSPDSKTDQIKDRKQILITTSDKKQIVLNLEETVVYGAENNQQFVIKSAADAFTLYLGHAEHSGAFTFIGKNKTQKHSSETCTLDNSPVSCRLISYILAIGLPRPTKSKGYVSPLAAQFCGPSAAVAKSVLIAL